jgi:hypothetical protein
MIFMPKICVYTLKMNMTFDLLSRPFNIRTLGVTFLLLYSAGHLPAPFAPAAGWGDIAIGAHRGRHHRATPITRRV